MQWEIVVGLETHTQLTTESKIFSGASTAFGAEPNAQACAVDLALPGVLPVMNKAAVQRAIQFGLAVGAKVAEHSVFARKIISILICPRATKSASLKFRWCRAAPSAFCWAIK